MSFGIASMCHVRAEAS